MEEIREVALAYYNNMSEDEKREAYQAFKTMDSNGDEIITIDELLANTPDDAEACRTRSLFRELDKNRDGKLDFNEFVTLFYLLKSQRVVRCAGTGCNVTFIKGVYFTCVECFNQDDTTTYDLCVSCYRYKKYDHIHSNFLDSHFLLLRSRAEYNNGAKYQPQLKPDSPDQLKADPSASSELDDPNQLKADPSDSSESDDPDQLEPDPDSSESDSPDIVSQVIRSGSSGSKSAKIVNGLRTGITIGEHVVSIASTGCSIM